MIHLKKYQQLQQKIIHHFFKSQTDDTAVNEEEGSIPTCTGSSESEPQVEPAVVGVKVKGAHEQFLKPSSYTHQQKIVKRAEPKP